MTDSKFQRYLRETFRKTLFEAGRRFYEERLSTAKKAPEPSVKEQYLLALSDLAATLAREAVELLSKNGISTEEQLLARQRDIVEILGRFESELRRRLLKLDEADES